MYLQIWLCLLMLTFVHFFDESQKWTCPIGSQVAIFDLVPISAVANKHKLPLLFENQVRRLAWPPVSAGHRKCTHFYPGQIQLNKVSLVLVHKHLVFLLISLKKCFDKAKLLLQVGSKNEATRSEGTKNYPRVNSRNSDVISF